MSLAAGVYVRRTWHGSCGGLLHGCQLLASSHQLWRILGLLQPLGTLVIMKFWVKGRIYAKSTAQTCHSLSSRPSKKGSVSPGGSPKLSLFCTPSSPLH